MSYWSLLDFYGAMGVLCFVCDVSEAISKKNVVGVYSLPILFAKYCVAWPFIMFRSQE